MKSKLAKKITSITLTAAMLMSIFGTLGSAVFAADNPTGLDLIDGDGKNLDGNVYSDSVSIDQGYGTTDTTTYTGADKAPKIVKVSWEIGQITITRTTNKLWDSSSLSWKDANDVDNTQNTLSASATKDASATFTLESYMDEDVNATIKYAEASGKPVTDLSILKSDETEQGTTLTKTTDDTSKLTTYSRTTTLAKPEDRTQPTKEVYTVAFSPDTANMSQEEIKALDGTKEGDIYGSYTVTIAEVKAQEEVKAETAKVTYTLTGSNAPANTVLTSKGLLDTQNDAVTYTDPNSKTCTAYNGYITDTAYANWTDATTFVQKLNDAQITPSGKTYGTASGQGTWRLLSSDNDASAWYTASNKTNSFGDVNRIWSSAEDGSDYACYWNCSDVFLDSTVKSYSSSIFGFVVVWEQN